MSFHRCRLTGGNPYANPIWFCSSKYRSGYGESLAGFITGISEPNGGLYLWVNEKSNFPGGLYNPPYPPGCTPRVDCKAVGHYTQMVWQNTREIGCGTAPPGAGGLHYSILVCRYDPPGNYRGQYPYPPKS